MDLATRTGYTTPFIRDLLENNKPITPQIAEAFAKAFETTTDYWLKLEEAYRPQ